jgi:hypothetical protein
VPNPSGGWRAQPLGYWLLLAFAVFVYTNGLGGHYIPRNGDEMVYAHIARLTAATGHWLPLASELENMRNTKPPVLFWQAMVAGNWGSNWTLTALRLPSLGYTFLVTAGIIYLVQRLSRDLRLGLLAGVIYLAFFCTFRYGRPYLTSAAESFWFNLPIFVLLLRHARGVAADKLLTWPLALLFGLCFAAGLLYKSFALIAPAGACLALVAWWLLRPSSLQSWFALALKLATSCALAIGIFALWFAIDPDPQAVWKEFILFENASKMNNSRSYWASALWGDASIWLQLMAYVQNAGLLGIMVWALMLWGLREAWKKWRGVASPHCASDSNFSALPLAIPAVYLWTMLGCLLVWLAIFTVPSQRSARYVIPASPFLAILLAVLWHRLSKIWFFISFLPNITIIWLLFAIGYAAFQIGAANEFEWLTILFFTAIAAAALLIGCWPRFTRPALLVACVAVLASFNAVVAPLDGSAASFTLEHSAQWRGKRVAVPSGFNGQFERYQFILPGNRFVPHADGATPEALLAQFDGLMWVGKDAPACVATNACQIVGTRWDVRSRHASGEITLSNIARPQEWLFQREWLISR